MPPRSTVETRSWGTAATARTRARYFRWSQAPSGIHLADRRELLRPDRVELAVLPLEHVMLDALVGVLPVLRELHAPAVERGAHRQVQRHDRAPEPVEVIRLRLVQHQLEEPEPGTRQPVAREGLGAGPLLHRVGELALELLRLLAERLDPEARPGLGEHERAIAVSAERLPEVGGAVPGGAGVDQRLEQGVLLTRLAPEQHGVVAARDVVDDVGLELLELGDDGREVVGRGEGVVLGGDLLHAELALGPLARRFSHALAV